MSTERLHRPAIFWLLWAVVLLGPFAWAASLGLNSALVGIACERGAFGPLTAVSVACALFALGAAAAGALALTRVRGASDEEARSRFMLQLGVGLDAISALVIVLSAVPVLLLSPCPA